MSAFVVLIVPPFLVRALPPAEYGAWALVLQLAAYVGYLEFGIQTAVGRFVARGNDLADFEYRDKIVSTAFSGLLSACMLALVGISLLIAFLPSFFHTMPAALYSQVRLSLALIGGSLAIGLPSSVFNGIFAGLQRYDIPAAITTGCRITGAVLLVVIARKGLGMVAMAISVALMNFVSQALQWWMFRVHAGNIRISRRLLDLEAGKELAGYCASLTAWSLGLLLVSGLDLFLVGMFDFGNTPFYAVAVTAVAFLAGLQNSVFSVMMPRVAILHSRGEGAELGRFVSEGTRYGMFLLFLTGVPLLFEAKPILRLWVGSAYADRTSLFLCILVIANIIRLATAPYIVALIGTGQQRLVVLTPLLEGSVNLLISVWAGYRWGAIGVAIGTLCGAVVGLAGNLLYNMPRTSEIKFSIGDYAVCSLLRPILCLAPLGLAMLANRQQVLDPVRGFIAPVALLACIGCVWQWGLIGVERGKVRRVARLSGLWFSRSVFGS